MGRVKKIVALFILAAAAIAGFMIWQGNPTASAVAPPVTAEVILSGCEQCWDTNGFLANMQGDGVNIERTLYYQPDSAEARQMIEKYNITRLPTVVLSSQLLNYSHVVPRWMVIGSMEADGSFVLRVPNPPYVELPSGHVRGEVELIELVDSGCAACYDVGKQKQALGEQFGIAFGKVTRQDVAGPDGRALVEKYNITAVPTVLLSPELGAYLFADGLWAQLGDRAADGWYVFRNMQATNGATWKDITTGQIHVN